MTPSETNAPAPADRRDPPPVPAPDATSDERDGHDQRGLFPWSSCWSGGDGRDGGSTKNPGPYADWSRTWSCRRWSWPAPPSRARGCSLAWRQITAGRAGTSKPISWRRSWKSLTAAALVTFAWLGLSLFGTYKAYQHSDSTVFCGLACHQVMEPEYTAYLHSDHARVACVSPHVGRGRTWFVKSKVTGWARCGPVARPDLQDAIKTPIATLRPRRRTPASTATGPGRFSAPWRGGSRTMPRTTRNTETRFKLLLRVGGRGRRIGLGARRPLARERRWKVEYLATDEKRQDIPTSASPMRTAAGRSLPRRKFDRAGLDEKRLRTMDCLDCPTGRRTSSAPRTGRWTRRWTGGGSIPASAGIRSGRLGASWRRATDAGRGGGRHPRRPSRPGGRSGRSRPAARARPGGRGGGPEDLRVNFFPEHGSTTAPSSTTGPFRAQGVRAVPTDGRHRSPTARRPSSRSATLPPFLVARPSGVNEWPG